MSGTKRKYRHTAYDDAFRTVEQECNDALLHFVNHMFGEHYKSSAAIVHLRNEKFVVRDSNETEKRISDSHFRITEDSVSKDYHLECESGRYDDSIVLGMFQYSELHSTKDQDSNMVTVVFPHAGLLMLNCEGEPPDHMIFEIVAPTGSVKYDVPVVWMSDYTLDDLFEKKMYFLIPFYFFNLKKELVKYNTMKNVLRSSKRNTVRLWRECGERMKASCLGVLRVL